MVAEAGRYALATREARRTRRATPYSGRRAVRASDPVILVPGFMAGDATLAFMARSLRQRGFRTYRSHIHANVGCTLNAAAQLESRLESIVLRRGTRVQIVGHSLGGMLARGLAVRRPDLVSGIVTMGSPMLAPGAHHAALSFGVDVLVRLSRAGVPGLMSEECVAGTCARQSWDESRQPVPDDVAFTAIYSQARRHLRLAGLHRPGGDPGRGHRVTRRHGRGPAGDRPGHRGAALRRVAGPLARAERFGPADLGTGLDTPVRRPRSRGSELALMTLASCFGVE